MMNKNNHTKDNANSMLMRGRIDVDPSTITSGYCNGDVVLYKSFEYIFVVTDIVSGTGRFYKC